jgi:hypothetical protein
MEHQRWSKEKAEKWYRARPWLVGCNFIPSTAVNQLEMWQEDTFDPATIERELSWAANIGFNTVRVYLHDLAYDVDPSGFKEHIQTYLAIADSLNIATMFVFFDDCWNATVQAGKQPAPEPHIHNSHWVESPGLESLERFPNDEVLRNRLETYVRDIIETFSDDPRVLMWDLYNEPGNWTIEPGRRELVGEKCLPLLTAAFKWARAGSPSQPLTVGLFNVDYREGEPGSISRVKLENSDIITFHNYEDAKLMKQDIARLRELSGRPLICTEYMARTSGNTFEAILPLLSEERVGAINWGLVSGKTQTIYPWDSWFQEYTEEPELWYHDIFHPDGRPYDEKEVAFISSIIAKTQARLGT